MNKIAELRAERVRVLGQAKELAEKADQTAEDRSKIDELLAKADELTADITRREKLVFELAKLDKTEGRAVNNAKTASFNKTELGDTPQGALAHYVRTGDGGGLREQRAANNTGMNITTSADGGYAVPTGHYPEIIARRDEMMLATQLGLRAIPGKGTTVNVPIDDEADGEFATTAEMGDDNSTNVYERDAPALNVAAMTLVKKTKKIELTEELLEDEDSKILAFINDFIARGMAKTHNSMLLTEVLANGTAALTLDAAATIGSTEIPELVYKLADEYTEVGTVAWIMRRATEGVIRGLNGTAFQFAPTPAGLVAGARPGLWNYPVYNSAYAGACAASGKSLVFGNFWYVGYREGETLNFLRDPYTVDGKVILKYSFRQVYKVLQAEAVLYASHPSA